MCARRLVTVIPVNDWPGTGCEFATANRTGGGVGGPSVVTGPAEATEMQIPAASAPSARISPRRDIVLSLRPLGLPNPSRATKTSQPKRRLKAPGGELNLLLRLLGQCSGM